MIEQGGGQNRPGRVSRVEERRGGRSAGRSCHPSPYPAFCRLCSPMWCLCRSGTASTRPTLSRGSRRTSDRPGSAKPSRSRRASRSSADCPWRRSVWVISYCRLAHQEAADPSGLWRRRRPRPAPGVTSAYNKTMPSEEQANEVVRQVVHASGQAAMSTLFVMFLLAGAACVLAILWRAVAGPPRRERLDR